MSSTSTKRAPRAFSTFTTPARVISVPELTWSPTLANDQRLTYAQAEQAIAQLNAESAGGFADWRLPTLAELEAQRDLSRYNPAADPEQFPDTKPGFYWSSTPVAVDPEDYAWGVSFGGGYTVIFYRVGSGFVRAVRSVSPASPGQ